MTQPNYIERIHFTDNVASMAGGIVISYEDSDHSFVYYKTEETSCSDPELAFHDVRLSQLTQQGDYYLQIDIPNSHLMLYQFDIYEENTQYLKAQLAMFSLHYQNELDTLSLRGKAYYLKDEIDRALENSEFDRVQNLQSELEILEGGHSD